MKDVWNFTAPKRGEKMFGKHPTQKPMILLERILLAASNEGDLVLDPFLGSGTTALACLALRRKCVGIESDVAHISLAATRVRESMQQKVVQPELEVGYAGTGTSGK